MKVNYIDRNVTIGTPLENCVIGDIEGRPSCYDEPSCIDCYYPLKDWNTHRWIDGLGDFVCKDCFNYYKEKKEVK